MPAEIIIGRERRERLVAFGLPAGLLEALESEVYDPITALVAASDGTVLAEIAGLVGVAGALPSRRIVPICQIDESDPVYYLLVDDELIWWSSEAEEPVIGGVLGLLTDLVISAWEAEADPHEIVRWAERIGHPAGQRLVQELSHADRSTRTAARRFRRAFLQSLEVASG